MDDFRISAEGVSAAEEQLGRLLERTGDLTPLMETLGEVLVQGTRRRFESGVAPDGTPWAPSIRVQKEGGKTLMLERRLRNSVQSLASATQVEVGSDLIYAGVHQLGATIRPVNAKALRFELPGGLGVVSVSQVVIPARPYLGISANDEASIEHTVTLYAEATQ